MKNLKDYFKELDICLTILVIIDVILILGSILFSLSQDFFNFILVFDTLLCIILIINFIMKLRRSRNKKLFFKNNWIDLFASLPIGLLILPLMINTLYAYPVIVLIRLLKLILLFKVLSKFIKRLLDATYLDKVIAILIIIVICSTIVLYYYDPSVTNFFDALWFVFQTITTVGYGDIVPSSPIGQLVGFVLLIVGVLAFSILTASFAYVFNERIFKKENEEFNQKVNTVKDNLNETKSAIDEIKEKTLSNEEELAEMKESIDNLSERIDNLIELLENK